VTPRLSQYYIASWATILASLVIESGAKSLGIECGASSVGRQVLVIKSCVKCGSSRLGRQVWVMCVLCTQSWASPAIKSWAYSVEHQVLAINRHHPLSSLGPHPPSCGQRYATRTLHLLVPPLLAVCRLLCVFLGWWSSVCMEPNDGALVLASHAHAGVLELGMLWCK